MITPWTLYGAGAFCLTLAVGLFVLLDDGSIEAAIMAALFVIAGALLVAALFGAMAGIE